MARLWSSWRVAIAGAAPDAAADGSVAASTLGDAIGIGWFLREVDGVGTVGHGGSANGQFAELLAVPERDFAVVALSNADPDGTDGSQLRLGVRIRAGDPPRRPRHGRGRRPRRRGDHGQRAGRGWRSSPGHPPRHWSR
jgi:beta-lactamase family protein